MSDYTILDYNEYLLAENSLMGIPGKSTVFLTEEQGVVPMQSEIIDEITDAVKNAPIMPYDEETSYLASYLTDYKVKTDCFIGEFSLFVFFGKKGDKWNGSYVLPNAKTKIDDKGKLSDFRIFIGVDWNSLDTKESEIQFSNELSHELQHAYRIFKILSSGDNAIRNEKKLAKRYTVATQMMLSNETSLGVRQIATLYYLTEKDEISSMVNEVFEYVRKNPSINNENYEEFLDDIPLYHNIKTIGASIVAMDENSDDEDFVKNVGEVFKAISGNRNTTSKKAFKEFKNRLVSKYAYSKRVFYRVLNHAFEKFGRYVKRGKPNARFADVDEMVNEIKNIEDIDGILKKFKV